MVLVFNPYLYLLQRCSHSHPILLSSSGVLHHSKYFLGSEEMTVLFPGYMKWRHTLDKTVLVPICHMPDKCFPLSLLPSSIWNQEKKMIPLILDPEELFGLPRAWTRSTRAHVSCLPTPPYDSPHTLFFLTTPLPSPASQEAHRICGKYVPGDRELSGVRRGGNLGNLSFSGVLDCKRQDCENQIPGPQNTLD